MVWVQQRGWRKWPSFFVADSMAFELIDGEGERLLARAAPEAEWTTCRADVIHRDGELMTTHSVLQVRDTVALRSWRDPEGFELQDGVPDGQCDAPPLARQATGDGANAAGLYASPSVASRLRERRLRGIMLDEIPWESELAGRIEGWPRLR